MATYTLQQIADRVGGQLLGDGDTVISGVNPLDTAGPGQITFVRDRRHVSSWHGSAASAALVSAGVHLEPSDHRALVRVDDADLAVAAVLEMFAPPVSRPGPGVHPSALIDPTAELAAGVAVGPRCVVGKRVRLAAGAVLYAGVTVMDDCQIGPRSVLYPGVVLYDRCRLGAGVTVHANAVIGSDGFGYRPAPDGCGPTIKIPQIGTVEIGDEVEIGAGTCIDRGKFSATQVGDGTKIDNLCQIAHNARIGRRCILAGQVGLAGSVTVGDGAVLGGQVGVADHLTIGPGARIAAKAGVVSHVPPEAVWYGHPAREIGRALRQVAALRRLPQLVSALRKQDRLKRAGISNDPASNQPADAKSDGG